MAVRSIKVWNASASAWEGVGVEAPDFGGFVAASIFTDVGQLLSSSGSGSAIAINIEDDQLILSSQVFG